MDTPSPQPIPINLPPAPAPPTAAPPPVAPPPLPIKKSPFRFLFPVLAILALLLLGYLILSRVLPKLLPGAKLPGANTSTQPVNLTYWGLWEPPEIIQPLIADFEATHPNIKINYEQQSIKDYRERLQNSLATNQGPDIFRFHLTWTSQLASSLTPVPDSVLTPSAFEAEQYPVATRWLKSGKNYLGLPLMYEGLGLYYNKAIFDAAGKTPPATWDDLRQTAILLTSKTKDGVIQRAGIALGTTSNVDNWSDILGVMLLQNGADPKNPDTETGQGALTFYTHFSRVDKVWDDTLPTSTIAFATEKAAMMIAPSWRALEVRSINPNLTFAIAPLPQLPETKVGWASIWVDGVNQNSSAAVKAASWQFLSYLNQQDTLRNWYTLASKQRLFGEMYGRSDMADQLALDPYVGAYLSQAASAQTWYLNSNTYDNGPNDKIIKYYQDAVNAVLAGDSPKEVLATVTQGVAQIINQYRLP